MRKRILALTIACLTCLALTVGCSGNNEAADASSSAANASSPAADASSPAENVSDAAEDVGENLADENYRTWTKSDWDKASKEDQMKAAQFVLMQVGDALADGFSDLVKQAEEDPQIAGELEEQVEAMRTSISSYFASTPDEDATLNSLIEDTQAVFEQVQS